MLFSCSEPMWPIEARCAAIANNYFTVAINRVGTVSLHLRDVHKLMTVQSLIYNICLGNI